MSDVCFIVLPFHFIAAKPAAIADRNAGLIALDRPALHAPCLVQSLCRWPNRVAETDISDSNKTPADQGLRRYYVLEIPSVNQLRLDKLPLIEGDVAATTAANTRAQGTTTSPRGGFNAIA
jgi:hypothetical protein